MSGSRHEVTAWRLGTPGDPASSKGLLDEAKPKSLSPDDLDPRKRLGGLTILALGFLSVLLLTLGSDSTAEFTPVPAAGPQEQLPSLSPSTGPSKGPSEPQARR